MPDCDFGRVRRVAGVVHEILDELGAVGWPKTSGGRGLHVYVRIRPEHGFADVTTAWWRRDREPDLVFVDYNQNARDHTIAAATPYAATRRASSPPHCGGRRSQCHPLTTRRPLVDSASPRRTEATNAAQIGSARPSRGASLAPVRPAGRPRIWMIVAARRRPACAGPGGRPRRRGRVLRGEG